MRVAVYYTPPADHPLSTTAARWLGRDAFANSPVAQPEVAGLPPATLRDITADPRRYGFHATLKPPFRLAEGKSLADLTAAVAAFSAGRATFVIPALALTRIGPFFALTEAERVPALHQLADDVVRALDPFRAPPSEAEIARRRPEHLSERQRQYLAEWGYPYVFDEFQFHLSLTGRVPPELRDPVEAALRHQFDAFIGQPLAIDALALFNEPHPPGDFVVGERLAFPPV